MNISEQMHWFPAKRFGWGWGFPSCWQGWTVLAAYLVLFAPGVIFLHGRASPAMFIAYASVLTLALLLVCWKKGEPPRWRWGGD